LALDDPASLRAALPGSILEVVVDDHRHAAAVLASVPGVEQVQMFGERAHVRVARADDDVRAALAIALGGAGLNVREIRPIAASLEDVFIAKLEEARS
jgi:hypothetical protein